MPPTIENPEIRKLRPFSARRGGDYTVIGQGLSHSLKETNMQLFAKANLPASMPLDQATTSGFIASFATALRTGLKRVPTDSELQQSMNCFDPIQLPVLSTLAQNFVLCDHWFADVPGPTMPNRAAAGKHDSLTLNAYIAAAQHTAKDGGKSLKS